MTDRVTASERGGRERAQATRRRTEALARLLDSAIGIPGTRIRFGLDALIGLIPGVGDVLGFVLGAWFLVEGLRVGAPSGLLARMAGNLAIDALAGFVPLIGDLVDIGFKANRRNAALLGAHLDRLEGRAPPPPQRNSRAATLAVILAAVAAIYLIWRVTSGWS